MLAGQARVHHSTSQSILLRAILVRSLWHCDRHLHVCTRPSEATLIVLLSCLYLGGRHTDGLATLDVALLVPSLCRNSFSSCILHPLGKQPYDSSAESGDIRAL